MSGSTKTHEPEYIGLTFIGLDGIKCRQEDCHFILFGGFHSMEFYLREFKHHADQYLPGRAPNVAVDWEISACCSVCEDGIGDIEVVDGETIRCTVCKTTWDMQGNGGERNDE